MKSAYRGIAHGIAACVVLQTVWIALAWFGVLSDVDRGKVFDKGTAENLGQTLHSAFGIVVVPLLGIALLIVSLGARIPGGTRFAGLVLTAIVVQVALAYAAYAVPAVGALHGLNAFAVVALAEVSARRAGSERPSVADRPDPRQVV